MAATDCTASSAASVGVDVGDLGHQALAELGGDRT
jgi:hypothetical protein